MRSIVSLVSGIVVVVGALFVSWLSVVESGGQDRVTRLFGREIIGGDAELVSTSGPILTVIGGVLLIVIALVSFIMVMANLRARRTYLTLSLGARLAALLVIAGATLYFTDVTDNKAGLEEYYYPDGAKVMIEEGVFISLFGALPGLIIGVTTPFSVWNMLFRRRGDEEGTEGRIATPVQRREEYYTNGEAVDGLTLRKGYSEKLKGTADEVPSGTPEEHFTRAVRYEAEGKYDEAIDEYDAAIIGNANYPLAHSNRGSLHLVLGHSVKALYDFEKVIELSDDPDLAAMAQDRVDELNEQTSDDSMV
ncbi:MAG: tetratricopeptide repeat protein [Chloroflexi bacterium]|nr:tetratricopeptide repeat protein [Chloroflexota bacterium]